MFKYYKHVNYLIDKLILSDELRNFLEFPTT